MNCCFFPRTIISVYFLSVCLSTAKHTVFPHDNITPGETRDNFVYTKTRIKREQITSVNSFSQDRNNITTSPNITANNVNGKNDSENITIAENNYAGGSPKWLMNINSGALERTGFVALGIMSVLLTFFVIRAIRVRQKKSKSRKYGVITSTVSDMEMEPLERGDDDEEDTTLFDAQHKYRIK